MLKKNHCGFFFGFFSKGCGSIQASVPQRSIKKTSERSDAVNTATSNPPNVSKWTHASDVSDYPASQQLYCNYICARRRWLMGLIFLGCQSQHPAPLARTAAVYLCTSPPQLSTIEKYSYRRSYLSSHVLLKSSLFPPLQFILQRSIYMHWFFFPTEDSPWIIPLSAPPSMGGGKKACRSGSLGKASWRGHAG